LQEKEQKNSPIKQRILHFAQHHCDSKREFYARTGISRGTLESKTGITESTLVKFFTTYKNVNPFYFITGEGEILKHKTPPGKKDSQQVAELQPPCEDIPQHTSILRDIIKEKDKRIEELCTKVGGLQYEVAKLKKDSNTSCHSNTAE
jgi:hypothetical protein